MKRTMILAAALGILAPVALVGCGGEETKVEKTEKVETPGGSVTKTSTDKVEKTGDAKDGAPADTAK